jgi:hypothetical protein
MPYHIAIPLLSTYPNEIKSYICTKKSTHKCLQKLYLQLPKTGNNPNFLKPCINCKLRYAKWEKTDSKNDIFHEFIWNWYDILESQNSIKTKIMSEVARGWSGHERTEWWEYPGMYFYQNSWHCKLKRVYFTVCKLYLNLKNEKISKAGR